MSALIDKTAPLTCGGIIDAELKEEAKKEAEKEAREGGEASLPLVCFVCTGNTCRSPMAAAYLRSRGYKYAFSRGTAALEGMPISDNAAKALARAGIEPSADNDYRSHQARLITEADAASADIIYAVTRRHADALFYAFPRFAEKIRVLNREISDPFGGDGETYDRALTEIIAAINESFGLG